MASATQVVCVPKLMMEKAFSGQFLVEVRPTVGRSPTTPHSAEGTRTEPPPSMPGFTSSYITASPCSELQRTCTLGRK